MPLRKNIEFGNRAGREDQYQKIHKLIRGKPRTKNAAVQLSDKEIEFGTRVGVSCSMVNQQQSLGNSCNLNIGMPFTLTLGCGTRNGNIT